jgi:site-specific DNA-methyltransferase (adenine-specific)/modification methylase
VSAVREERIGPHVLYMGDAREIAGDIRADLLLTDPPYGIGYQRGDGGLGKHSARRTGLDHRHDAALIGDDSPFDPLPWLTIAPNVILWGANHYAARLPHGRWLAWNKLGGQEPWDSYSDVEFAWHNRRGADRIFSHLWKGLCQAGGGVRREHPTQKPEQLGAWCIEQAGILPGATILDPYAGSGTFGVAAVLGGYRAVCIEIEPRYFDIMVRRIEAASRQADLFHNDRPPPAVRAVQPDMLAAMTGGA